jgi:hypothetical protein
MYNIIIHILDVNNYKKRISMMKNKIKYITKKISFGPTSTNYLFLQIWEMTKIWI